MHTEEPLYIRGDKMTEENVGIEEAPKCKQTSNKDSYYSQNSRREIVTQVHKKKRRFIQCVHEVSTPKSMLPLMQKKGRHHVS